MKRISLAIDPGTTESGWVLYNWDSKTVLDMGIAENEELLSWLWPFDMEVFIEMVASYGMAVGKDVFETCTWIGKFELHFQKHKFPVHRIFRRDVKLHLCNSVRAKDANIRQALLDRFPATGGGKTPQVGTQKQPGPLYGVKSHIWSALAIAVYASERENGVSADATP